MKSKARYKLIQATKTFLSRDSKELFVQRFCVRFNQVRKYVKAQNQIAGFTVIADFTVIATS